MPTKHRTAFDASQFLDTDPAYELIGQVRRGEDQIVVAIRSYQGKRYIDVRRHFLNVADRWCPTGKGITLHLEGAKALITLLQRTVERFASSRGGDR